MKKVKYILLVFISLTMISCGGKDDGGGGNVDPPDPVNPPTASSLISPANNTECLDGENVEFRWNSSQYTDTYTINIKNLLTQKIEFDSKNPERVGLTITSKIELKENKMKIISNGNQSSPCSI